ncbi:hypothetical protein RND71_033953 [Anisodus tanguticus]|uniref:CSC1/OSCA1-like cytosolic domain-containing protein n=1 Tax=Anisodus tanguticus TaxID=243964 RepID=A0AAE1RAC3_9SOLA|nr:hypothetical protein RND71_033953 [Anisodus tanguticus]
MFHLDHSGFGLILLWPYAFTFWTCYAFTFWTCYAFTFWTCYAFTFWTCFVLKTEYAKVAAMRLQFVASEKRRPDQYTVLVRNGLPDADESGSECVEHFFLVNHQDHYLMHQGVYDANKLAKLVREKKSKENWLDYYQLKYSRDQSKRPMMKTGFLGCFGEKVYAIDHQTAEIERLSKEIRGRVCHG